MPQGSYIFQTATESYGKAFIPNPGDADRFKATKYLRDIDKSGKFKSEQAEIVPLVLEANNPVETTPIDKDLRFLFPPNEAKLDLADKNNKKYLESLAGLLRAGVGSRIQLTGHVEGSQVAKFKAQGEVAFKQIDLSAINLSKNRARAVKDALVDKYSIDPERVETLGKGWNESLGGQIDNDRRVQAQWITVN